jgi:hypothetical protein
MHMYTIFIYWQGHSVRTQPLFNWEKNGTLRTLVWCLHGWGTSLLIMDVVIHPRTIAALIIIWAFVLSLSLSHAHTLFLSFSPSLSSFLLFWFLSVKLFFFFFLWVCACCSRKGELESQVCSQGQQHWFGTEIIIREQIFFINNRAGRRRRHRVLCFSELQMVQKKKQGTICVSQNSPSPAFSQSIRIPNRMSHQQPSQNVHQNVFISANFFLLLCYSSWWEKRHGESNNFLFFFWSESFVSEWITAQCSLSKSIFYFRV